MEAVYFFRKKSLDEEFSKKVSRLSQSCGGIHVNAEKFNFWRREFKGKKIDLGKLTMKCKIGQGAFASVHHAIYDGQEVAVKVLELEQGGQNTKAQIRKEFDQEISVWNDLDHPNIVKFIGAYESDDINTQGSTNYMVAEYLSRGTLRSYLRKKYRKKLSLKKVVQIALDIARGLSYLHSKKVAHRDIKPENMLFDKTSKLKITDFGVSRKITDFDFGVPRLDSLNQCEMTTKIGTFGYMAPEVLEGKPYDTKCDVYSFGICLWEIYCCDVAFHPENLSSAILRKEMRPEIPKCCPNSLANLMKSCWSSEPRERPEMKDVITILENINTSKGGGTIPPHQPGCFSFFHLTIL